MSRLGFRLLALLSSDLGKQEIHVVEKEGQKRKGKEEKQTKIHFLKVKYPKLES